jgi:amino acid permease
MLTYGYFQSQVLMCSGVYPALSSYLGRKAFVNQGGQVKDLKFKMPLYPIVPLLAFGLNCLILISLAFIPEQRIALYCGVPFMLACYLYYHLVAKHKMQEPISINQPKFTELKKV